MSDLADIDVVDENSAVCDIIETDHQIGHRGLSGSGLSNQGNCPARFYGQAEVLENGSAVVGEGHLPELDFSPNVWKLHGIGGIANFRFAL